jgi:hypothetical protein
VKRGLRRYWLRFDPSAVESSFVIGIGVTGFDKPDALGLAEATCFQSSKMPDPAEVVENIDVRTLDQGHVIPNMHPPSERGVWFPKMGAF